MAPGDRVIVFSQNCPQFIAAYFAILRADAVFVPVNAMLLREELEHIVEDSGAVAAFVASELLERVAPLVGKGALRKLVVHAYGDALGDDGRPGLLPPDWVRTRMVRRRSCRRPPCPGRPRWRRTCRPHRTAPAPTTCACCPTPRAPPASPRPACTRTAR